MPDEQQNHCRDCCCARSWKALGITRYTGRSIPEHIDDLVKALRFYADGGHYRISVMGDDVLQERGDKARKALGMPTETT